MEGSGLMIELQTSMEYEGYVSIQIKTSEFAAFLVISPLFRQESADDWSYNNLETIIV